MSSPIISIIIPHYNHTRVLARALESIFVSSHCERSEAILFGLNTRLLHPEQVGVRNDDLEVIVVDDGSDIAQKEYLRQEIMPRFPRVKFIFAEHAGAAAARNRGFRKSRGKYVIFWDADIVGRSNMLTKMKKALGEHPETSYAYSSFKFGWKKFTCGSFDAKKLRRANYITTTSLIRREHFPGFDESLKRFQDWDLWLTMLEQGHQGVWIPETLFQIINTKGAMSRWLPSFMYRFSWLPLSAIKKYFYWQAVVQKKHGINASSH